MDNINFLDKSGLQKAGKEMMDEMMQKLKEARGKMGHANIVIAGKTGVGKSTLINTCFGSELTKTGIGKPVTKEAKLIEKDGFPLRIYDTVGLELDSNQQQFVENGIVKYIRDMQLAGDPDKMIHFIWYCINSTSNRVEQKEIDVINKLGENFANIPIIVILTQSSDENSKELKKIHRETVFKS